MNGRKETNLLWRIPNNAIYVFRDRLSFHKYLHTITHDNSHDAALRPAPAQPSSHAESACSHQSIVAEPFLSIHPPCIEDQGPPSLVGEGEIKDSECGVSRGKSGKGQAKV